MQSSSPRPGPLAGFRFAKGKAGISSAQIGTQMGIAEATVVMAEDGAFQVTAEFAGAYREALIACGAGAKIAGSHQNL